MQVESNWGRFFLSGQELNQFLQFIVLTRLISAIWRHVFFCNGFIIYRPRYTSCFKNQNISILLNDLVCSMLSVPFSLSFSPLIFTAFSWNYLIVLENLFYLLFWATLPCQAPNERATTLTRSAISNETQQIMPEKCPVK